MSKSTIRPASSSRSVLALLLTTCLAACHGSADNAGSSTASSADALAALPAPLPMSTAQPTALPSAPPVSALPSARPVRVGRLADPRQGYAYLDRAYYQQDAVEDAPPDYAFDDSGVQPWVWQAGGDGRVISEPVDGGYRYYYYNPGADTPYLVRDPDRAYAYNGEVLVGVFTLAGGMVDYGPQSTPALYGARYFERGRALWNRADSGPHQPMNAYAWDQRRRDVAARRAAWQQQMAANAQWSDWAASHRDQEESYWQPVRARHQQAAQAFEGWQQQHFAGPQPQFYAPPHNDGGPPPAARPPAFQHPAMAGAAALGVAGAGALAAHAVMQQRHPAPPAPPAGSAPNAWHHPSGPQGSVMPQGPLPHGPMPSPPGHEPRPQSPAMANHGPHAWDAGRHGPDNHPGAPAPSAAAQPVHGPAAPHRPGEAGPGEAGHGNAQAHPAFAQPMRGPAMPPHHPQASAPVHRQPEAAPPVHVMRPPVEAAPHRAPPAQMPHHAPAPPPMEHAAPPHPMAMPHAMAMPPHPAERPAAPRPAAPPPHPPGGGQGHEHHPG